MNHRNDFPSVVAVIRQFNNQNECLAIYGVYKNENQANMVLEHKGYTFDPITWVWRDELDGFFYRVDLFSVKEGEELMS